MCALYVHMHFNACARWPLACERTDPLGRIGQPSDVANAVVFLLESDYITGQVLSVDGGRAI